MTLGKVASWEVGCSNKLFNWMEKNHWNPWKSKHAIHKKPITLPKNSAKTKRQAFLGFFSVKQFYICKLQIIFFGHLWSSYNASSNKHINHYKSKISQKFKSTDLASYWREKHFSNTKTAFNLPSSSLPPEAKVVNLGCPTAEIAGSQEKLLLSR